MAKLVRQIGMVDPIAPQSMYIFKQPFHGGEVTPHQDSTFLWTEPRQTCVGLWLALEDAHEVFFLLTFFSFFLSFICLVWFFFILFFQLYMMIIISRTLMILSFDSNWSNFFFSF
jgi:hypothetical protein